jgi:hypothetical protein
LALKQTDPLMEADVGPIKPGIAAIGPLIPTKANMGLML